MRIIVPLVQVVVWAVWLACYYLAGNFNSLLCEDDAQEGKI